MTNLLRVIDHLKNNFNDDGSLPSWMKPIIDKLDQQDCPLSIRIFLTKLIINRPNVFTQETWAKHLLTYLALDQNGGKFIHYYFRDVAKLLIKFIKIENGYKPDPQIANKIIHKIIKALPHENNFIYSDNIDIL
jgi:hypothetical protein